MLSLPRGSAFFCCACLITAAVWLGGQSLSSAAAPDAIAEVGELGENIYDLAKESKWPEIAEKMAALAKASDALKSQVKGATESTGLLGKSLAALDKAIAANDRQATLQEANRITLIATDLAEPFHPAIPVDITRLDYYGRELELWSSVKDEAKIKQAAAALRQTWAKVRPTVTEHGGAKAAKAFDALIAKLKAAKTVKQYSRVATPILDEVDNLENVFTK